MQQRADELAASLNIEKTKIGEPGCELLLAVTSERLELRVIEGEADLVGGHGVYAELTGIDTTSPAGRKLDMPLLKAVGIKKGNSIRPYVIDCTGGFGEDAWLLASHDCEVDVLERNPIISALLSDSLKRAEKWYPHIADLIKLQNVDATNWLSDSLTINPKVKSKAAIVLDPMFPLGRKAKERKPMRVLRMLAGDDEDAPALLKAALDTGVHRVCVKRPLRAPVIEHAQRTKPDVVYKGKAVRFDVYINN